MGPWLSGYMDTFKSCSCKPFRVTNCPTQQDEGMQHPLRSVRLYAPSSSSCSSGSICKYTGVEHLIVSKEFYILPMGSHSLHGRIVWIGTRYLVGFGPGFGRAKLNDSPQKQGITVRGKKNARKCCCCFPVCWLALRRLQACYLLRERERRRVYVCV